MFPIDDKHRIDTSYDLPVITNNYGILHFDEMPILFMGGNEYGNRIVGSLLYEDTETDVFRYAHALIRDIDLHAFLSRKIGYRALLAEAKMIYIIDKDINDRILKISLVPFDEIPAEYLPLATAFCPMVEGLIVPRLRRSKMFVGVFDTGVDEKKIQQVKLLVQANGTLWA